MFAKLAAVIAVLFTVLSIGTAAAPLSDMTLIAENEYLALYINEANAEVAVLDKSSNQTWYSNPQDWNTGEKIANGTTKNQLGAQFIITYDRDNSEIIRDSYNHSVQLGQFTIVPIANGVRVEYLVNDLWQSDDYIPQVISKERMESVVLSELSAKDQNTILSNYGLFMLVELKEGESRVDVPGLRVRNLSKEKIFGNYTLLILDPSYQNRLADAEALRAQIDQLQQQIAASPSGTAEMEALQKQLKSLEDNYTKQINSLNKEKADFIWELLNKIADMRVDYVRLGLEKITFDHVKQFVNTPTYMLKQTPPFVRQNMVKVLKTTSYTPEDVIDDHIANNVRAPYPNIEVFRIAVEYVLDRDNLVVRVPMDQIEYPNRVPDVDGIKRTYPLKNIKLLPFFGAANMASEGYLFVPDGSGALVPFKHDKNTSTIVRCEIYGRDSTLDPLESVSVWQRQAHLPVFGMRSNNSGFVAIIEEGDALGTIVADVAGNRYSYNFVYSEFTVLNRGRVGLDRVGYINIYQMRPYQGEIRIRYKFLDATAADYVGMAKYYQNYLIDKYQLQPTDTGGAALFIDLIGAITVVRPVLGISMPVTVPLTTYEQAQEIATALLNEGIGHLYLRYTGMLAGGIRHRFPDEFVPEKRLGDRAGLNDLLEFAAENQMPLYLNVDFMHVYDQGLFSGFSSRRDAARLLNNSPAVVYNYNIATGQRIPAGIGNYLSPSRLSSVINSFVSELKPYQVSGLSLAGFGTEVYSDFNKDPQLFIDRQQSVQILQDQMQQLVQEEGLDLMVDGGNAVALPYVSSIVNVPLDTSGYPIASERVPFLPIVLRGVFQFAGQPLNMSSNIRRELLKAVEVGAGVQFVWSYADSSLVKETDFDAYLSLCYRDWFEQAIAIYREINKVSEALQGARISDHQKLAHNVYQTRFDNGSVVIVNYNDYPVQVGEIEIGAEDYLLVRGGI